MDLPEWDHVVSPHSSNVSLLAYRAPARARTGFQRIVGLVQGGSGMPYKVKSRKLGKLTGGLLGATLSVELVFRPRRGTTWAIDDVHIDPYSR
jgi:hypothetical protein